MCSKCCKYQRNMNLEIEGSLERLGISSLSQDDDAPDSPSDTHEYSSDDESEHENATGNKVKPESPLVPYKREDLILLLYQAISYYKCHPSARRLPLHWLYRDKKIDHFVDVIKTSRGIMKPYVKDNHGDPRSPINECLNGLFFTANSVLDPKTNQPKKISIYGQLRFLVPAAAMFNINTRLYFADFYCVNQKKKPHYVTLVATHAGSKADIFCQQHLVALNMSDNPFLVIQKQGKMYTMEVARCGGLCVELLYTCKVNIADKLTRGASFQIVNMVGRHNGNQRKPKPKNSDCKTCCLPNIIRED